MADEIRIAREPLTGSDALELITALNAELSDRYPEPGATHFRLDPDEVGPGRGAFFIARDAQSGASLGCGAVRVIEPGVGEVKRMFVRPTARGRKIGRAVLAAIEAEAPSLGISRLVLETGVRQHEAMELYRRAGFVTIEPWGEYIDSPLSVCLEKRLSSDSRPGSSA
jgi:putative acetyltransferase